jgi:hypothetical protein
MRTVYQLCGSGEVVARGDVCSAYAFDVHCRCSSVQEGEGKAGR